MVAIEFINQKKKKKGSLKNIRYLDKVPKKEFSICFLIKNISFYI